MGKRRFSKTRVIDELPGDPEKNRGHERSIFVNFLFHEGPPAMGDVGGQIGELIPVLLFDWMKTVLSLFLLLKPGQHKRVL